MDHIRDRSRILSGIDSLFTSASRGAPGPVSKGPERCQPNRAEFARPLRLAPCPAAPNPGRREGASRFASDGEYWLCQSAGSIQQGLVPLAGAEGAAWALLATELLRSVTLALLVARQARLRRLANHLPAALVVALAVTAGTSVVVQLAGGSQSLVGLGLAAAGSALGALPLAGALLRAS